MARTESAVVSFGVYDRSSGRRAPELWDWFHISRRVAVHMVPYDEEERLYECILLVRGSMLALIQEPI